MRFFFLIFISTALRLQGQYNLIPNGSFEILSNCPSSTYNLSTAPPWQPYLQSPDVFGTCATNPQVGVPQNAIGYKVPSTGLNYGGYCNWGGMQEILGVKLCDSLELGKEYFVSFKIALASGKGHSGAFSHHGMKLSTKNLTPQPAGVTTQTNNIVSNFAHVFSTQLVTDTLNWTTIKGSIIADSNYKFAYFGIFFQFAMVSHTIAFGNLTGTAYYYIDDVCLSNDSMACKTATQNLCHVNTNTVVIDTSTTNLTENTIFESIEINPNPAQNFITIKGKYSNCDYTFINSVGRAVLNGNINPSAPINIESLSSGFYFIQIECKTAKKTFKLLKE